MAENNTFIKKSVTGTYFLLVSKPKKEGGSYHYGIVVRTPLKEDAKESKDFAEVVVNVQFSNSTEVKNWCPTDSSYIIDIEEGWPKARTWQDKEGAIHPEFIVFINKCSIKPREKKTDGQLPA